MSTLSRQTTWVSQQQLTAAALNAEFDNVVNGWNNQDSGASTMTAPKAAAFTVTGTATVSGQLIAKGTATNDSASTGYIGEYVSSDIPFGSAIAAGTSTQFKNITSISLTAGDWDVSGIPSAAIAGATITVFEGVISAYSGNTTTDHISGDNDLIGPPPTGSYYAHTPIPVWRVSIAGTTTIYLKGNCVYSAGTPTIFGRISARRVR
jgi:hypothetical protein